MEHHNIDMVKWAFRVYVGPTGRNDVHETIENHDIYGKEAFKRHVEHLAVTPKNQWQEPGVKKLINEDPIYEIRYKADRRSTRALGYFAEDGRTFVIVLICHHKQRVYDPPGAFKSAHKRIEQIQHGSASTVPLQVDGEDVPADEEEP